MTAIALARHHGRATMMDLPAAVVPDALALGAAVPTYLYHLEHLRNASPSTVKSYRRSLASFFITPDRPVTGPEIREWLHGLEGRNLGPSSRALYWYALRAYARWHSREHESGDRWRAVLVRRAPRTPKPLPVWLKSEQIERLFAHLEQRNDGVGWRDRGLIELAYSTGARLSEVVGLNVADVDFGERDVLLRAKGRKELRAPFGRPAWEALQVWLTFRARVPNADPAALFLSLAGSTLGQRLSARRLQHMFNQHTAAVFGAPINFHALRHSCASHMVDAGANLRAVQALLGHESISSTAHYTHTALTRLKAIHRAALPRDKMYVPAARMLTRGAA